MNARRALIAATVMLMACTEEPDPASLPRPISGLPPAPPPAAPPSPPLAFAVRSAAREVGVRSDGRGGWRAWRVEEPADGGSPEVWVGPLSATGSKTWGARKVGLSELGPGEKCPRGEGAQAVLVRAGVTLRTTLCPGASDQAPAAIAQAALEAALVTSPLQRLEPRTRIHVAPLPPLPQAAPPLAECWKGGTCRASRQGPDLTCFPSSHPAWNFCRQTPQSGEGVWLRSAEPLQYPPSPRAAWSASLDGLDCEVSSAGFVRCGAEPKGVLQVLPEGWLVRWGAVEREPSLGLIQEPSVFDEVWPKGFVAQEPGAPSVLRVAVAEDNGLSGHRSETVLECTAQGCSGDRMESSERGPQRESVALKLGAEAAAAFIRSIEEAGWREMVSSTSRLTTDLTGYSVTVSLGSVERTASYLGGCCGTPSVGPRPCRCAAAAVVSAVHAVFPEGKPVTHRTVRAPQPVPGQANRILFVPCIGGGNLRRCVFDGEEPNAWNVGRWCVAARREAGFCPDRPGSKKGVWVSGSVPSDTEPHLWAFELKGGASCTKLTTELSCRDGCAFVCDDDSTAVLAWMDDATQKPLVVLVTKADGTREPRAVLRLFISGKTGTPTPRGGNCVPE